jgi:hypothetical protein
MTSDSTRREFIQVLAVGGVASASTAALGAGCIAAEVKPIRSGAALDRKSVEAEIQRRAKGFLRQPYLVVDYYRIGRRLAYPLPVKSLSLPDVPVPGISGYPWATWMTWTLEERILSLGWAAEWFQDEEACNAVSADLAALAQWPRYGQYAGTNLSTAHTGRVLWTASTRWSWVGEDLRRRLREACRRHVEGCLPASDKLRGMVRTKEDILHQSAPHGLLHNIGLIGTAGAALTAVAVQHPAAPHLNGQLQALFGAVLDLRAKGFSEGVAYDGYVLDFIADWLSTLPEKDRLPILDHPNLTHYLDQSTMLAAPGAAAQVAEIGDVEPREMPFHLSAQAKLLGLRGNATRAWHLARCPVDWFRTDGLAALRSAKSERPGKPPRAGALDAHYAAVLRSGWEADDLAVAVSCTNSPMGHLPSDNGTLVLGTRGKWLIADPGYQQYARGDEREFTIGPTAHNAPLINGTAQTQKRPRRIVLEEVGPSVCRVVIDLTACYPSSVPLSSLVRHVWLSGNNLAVVADQVEGKKPLQAVYHWHGHPASAWWMEANWALLTLDGVHLWMTCSQAQLSGTNLHRLPGSRGQLSLVCPVEKAGPVVWWAFVLGKERPVLHVAPDSRQIRLLDQKFAV